MNADAKLDAKLDAKADGQFQASGGAAVHHRAGYTEPLAWALKMARKGATLQAGEGLLLVQHFEERIAALEEERRQMQRAQEKLNDALKRLGDAMVYAAGMPE